MSDASGLVYDLGLHDGQDTEFYLKKGFRVVGVEANPALCQAAEARFASAIATGQLVVVNRAVALHRGPITFFINDVQSVWGTADPVWAERNRRLGAPSREITVEALPLGDLIANYGTPYYLKIDIEGMDRVALESLAATSERPRYVSIEAEKVSFSRLRQEFETFQALGYDRFKVVPQHRVAWQRPPDPPREGSAVAHRFETGASGLFGEEAPGGWISAEAAIEAYKRIFLLYHLAGDDPLLGSRTLVRVLRRLGLGGRWYDTHARLAAR
ncbi:MAG TPA: FkbM family methyltransferase [Roseomonas sp.]|jgi:FkbM family methyltransferase